jgi:uncharacterized Fe-S center protein
MPSDVYYHPVDSDTRPEEIKQITKRLLDTLIEKEGITLQQKIPLKVHSGEKGNVTFLKPETFDGIIDYLEERDIESCFIETSVLYGGKRFKKELHQQTAESHGFTRLPIVFADGDHGEDFAEVEIDQKNFKTFKVGRAFQDYDQMLVLAHFKGHMLAGFGGAIKQLSMGCAAKGGKLAMHTGEKPRLKSRKCKQCNLCQTRCNVDALVIGKKSYIDHGKCVGCGACMAICPEQAITPLSIKAVLKALGIGNPFLEKLVEGAFAAQKDKRNIYVNFAMNITRGCDCEGRRMKPIMDDIGIFVSSDPVAIDKACSDRVQDRGKKFRGQKTFDYAERIGLGSATYSLHDLSSAPMSPSLQA